MSRPLLDPTNDYVFKRLFVEAPGLLLVLINDVRLDFPPITALKVLNPNINPEELNGKYIMLDVLCQDGDGHRYNIEVQVRRYDAWSQRGLFYLARTLSTQLHAGENYQELRAAVGIHLLDFDLFTDSESERQQALWRFQMRDATQPQVSLGSILQMHIIELKKADRLGVVSKRLSDWIIFFKHWRDEAAMVNITHTPVKEAVARIRALSADEEARHMAFVRERALRDEVSFLSDAHRRGREEGREEGRQEGREEGLQQGIERGREVTQQETAHKLLQADLLLSDEQIAKITALSLPTVQRLRKQLAQ